MQCINSCTIIQIQKRRNEKEDYLPSGLKVQHHAMEFNKTYMVGIGKHFGDLDITARYTYQEATEIPIHNENVKAENFILQVGYRI